MAEKPKPPSPEQIQMAIEMIAQNSFSPSKPGETWAGESTVSHALSRQLEITKAVAGSIVAAAVEQLWSENPDNPARVERRLVITRLEKLRDRLYRVILKPRYKRRYDVVAVNDPEGKEISRRKVLKSVEKYDDTDAAIVTKIIEVEHTLIKLRGLDKSIDQQKLTRELIEHLEKMSGGEGLQVSGAQISVAQQVKQLTVFTDAGQQVIKRAKSQEFIPPPKPDGDAQLPPPTTT
jgi:hypothetical protein